MNVKLQKMPEVTGQSGKFGFAQPANGFPIPRHTASSAAVERNCYPQNSLHDHMIFIAFSSPIEALRDLFSNGKHSCFDINYE